MTKANPREGDVKREARKRLDKRGWFAFMPPANTYGISGISDTIALRKGVMIAVEMKLKKEEPTAPQEKFMGSIREHGGMAFLCNQRTLDDGSFDAFLTEAEAIGDELDKL